jgi:hypothetical protein
MALAGELAKYIGNEVVKTGGQSLAKAGAKSTLSSLVPSIATKAVSRSIPVTASKSLAQAISVGKPEMVDIYRGISAKTDDELAGYLRQMIDKSVKPTTYGGGSMQGEGYNFSTGRDVAEYFASRAPQRESRAVLHTRVPKNRFIRQNAQIGNRLGDFQLRAESRGIPYENGASARQAEKDMQRYFNRNGLLGIKSNSGETYVINQNDDAWLDNLDVFSASRGRGTRIEPDDNLLSTLRSILPQKKAEPVINYEIPSSVKEQVGKYIDGVVKAKPTLDAPATNNQGININTELGRVVDNNGKPITFYHSTPNEFSKFDDARLGENTGYSNTGMGHFVTTDKDFSKRFIDINDKGLTGRTMELQANIQKPITHPYMAGQKYTDPAELDKIVEDYLTATDNEEFLQTLREYADENGSTLYDEYMDMTFGGDDPFEFSADERKLLGDKGYDAVEIVEGPKSGLVEGSTDDTPVSSYAVFKGDNLRPVRHIPVQQDNSVPVSVKKFLPKLSPMSDDDASMLMENYSSNKANKLNGADTSADELVVRNIAKKNGVSKKTMDLMKKYADLTDNDTYNKAKTALNKLLTRDNKEVDVLDKMSRELLRTMGIEYENDMPVVYRATTANEAGSLSYTTDKKIAEKLLKNDDSYKKVIRYVVKPNDIVIAPQFLGPLDTGADLAHIIVKKA